ncbi:hypothetical protein P879_09468 [Paragonimus westermani]|uniref:Helicase C-terminal domain-containing protein n=1 Tax=Paragonimus westermani TaxID=34504 RepID=A0A8T0D295_9TREM|nr:hypothetical protein P879_09468 [Paragonimus westermani]
MPLERLRSIGAIRAGMGDLRPERMAKYTIVKAREDWSSGPLAAQMSAKDAGSIQCDFGLVTCLLHAIELLDQHGLRPLYQYLNGVLFGQRASGFVRTELMHLPGVEQIWLDLSNRFQSKCNSSLDLNSTQAPFLGGHPKLDKLKELLVRHFNSCTETRVIVFSQFRDSVDEIMHMLKQLRPLIRPASFTGQGSGSHRSPIITATSKSEDQSPTTSGLPTGPSPSAGISQRDQIRVMNAFRSGVYNTLVSTCVGEEGLDVGQVDLIVCFDAFKSPIRLMQRFGRTGRQRIGRIVMLLTEGREERNHAVSVARTSSIHKALLEGGAYRKLAFYPHNSRMVPLGLDPEVTFENLEALNMADVNTQRTTVKNETRKFQGIPKSRVLDDRLDKVRSHADAVGLHHLTLRLFPLCPSRLVSANLPQTSELVSECNQPSITELYNLTSTTRLKATRDCLQSRLIYGENRGSSTSSRHLVSILRLVELHRRGVTQLSFHALGLRSVDVDTAMDELLEGTDAATPELQTSLEPSQKASVSSSLSNASSSEAGVDKVTEHWDSNLTSLSLPTLVRGLVSGKTFFAANVDNIDLNLNIAMKDFSNYLDKPSANISLVSLKQAWSDHTEFESNWPDLSNNNNASERPKISSVTPDSAHASATFEADDDVDSNTLLHSNPSPYSGCFQTNLAAAFHLTTPSRCDVGVARSTPRAKPLQFSNTLVSTTQVNLSAALAMLDHSTIRLDASCLLEDNDDVGELNRLSTTPVAAHSINAPRSAIFTGPPLSNAGGTLQFGAKLLLSEDFGNDFLLPTQPIEFDISIGEKHAQSSPHSFCNGSDSYTFSSQINWSPLPVENDSEDSRTEIVTNNFPNQIVSATLGVPEPSAKRNHSDLDVDSPIVPPKRRAERHQKSKRILQSQSETMNVHKKSSAMCSKTKKRAATKHQFLLTQADAADDTDDEFELSDLDTYDDSFIDDGHLSETESNHTNQSDTSRLDASAMIGVYLKSVRSPPLKVAERYRTHTYPVSNKQDLSGGASTDSQDTNVKALKYCRPKTFRPYLFDGQKDDRMDVISQVFEQDEDYELDSFCIGNFESTLLLSPNKVNTRKPTINQARRIILADSE